MGCHRVDPSKQAAWHTRVDDLRLNPRDPIIGLRHPHLGDVELSLEHFDDAIDEYHKAVDLGFRTFIPYVI